jgi:PhnB protein
MHIVAGGEWIEMRREFLREWVNGDLTQQQREAGQRELALLRDARPFDCYGPSDWRTAGGSDRGGTMSDESRSPFEPVGLRAVRPYLIVGDANAAIAFYVDTFEATEIERYSKPGGGVAHAKLQIGDTILEIGEHPDATSREAEQLPRVGLRLYVTDVDETYARAVAADATGDPPSNRLPGVRSATVRDGFGLTWWLATPTE